MRHARGFTLIEVLIALAIVAILATLTFTTFINVQRLHSLDKTRMTAISLLEQARSNSVVAKNGQSHGVYFATSTMTLFEGSSYSPTAPQNISFSVSPYVTLKQVQVNGGGNEVVFNRLSGVTSDFGTIVFELSTDATTTKSIIVHQTGIIE